MIHLDRDSQEDFGHFVVLQNQKVAESNPMGEHTKYKVLKLCKSECLFIRCGHP
jgi:hypothetical protein